MPIVLFPNIMLQNFTKASKKAEFPEKAEIYILLYKKILLLYNFTRLWENGLLNTEKKIRFRNIH